MPTRQLGPFSVSAIGLGCMNLCHAYGAPVSAEQGERVLLAALDAGVTHFDTAALYGFGANETLVGKVLEATPREVHAGQQVRHAGRGCGRRRQAGARDRRPPRHDPGHLRGQPARLQTDVIDLYYLHRWDKTVPIEDSVGALADLVRAGKIRALACPKCPPPRCAGRTPCTRLPRCRPSIRCGRATPRSPCCRPAASWAWPLSRSARWRAVSCAGRWM
jgi:aryl-alcohol dehydrogenase-like predicted oxidoreductase